MKKIKSILITIIVVINLIPINAFSSNNVEEVLNPTPIYFDYNSKNNKGIRLLSDDKLTDEEYSQLYDAFYEHALKKDTSVLNIKSFNIKLRKLYDVGRVLLGILNDHPELFYLRSGYFYSSALNSTDEDLILGIRLIYTQYTSEEDAERFFSKVQYVLSSVLKDGMTDEDKVLALHDYLVDNIVYEEGEEGTHPENSFTPYAALIDGTAVCQGYSLAYNLLLKYVGIQSKYAVSDSMEHGWSVINLDGEWYHVDVTWDDPTNTEMVAHDYFLLSDETMNASDHYDWNIDVKCTSKKYEGTDYSFYFVTDKMKYYDGKFYYCKLIEVDIEDLPPNTLYYIMDSQTYIMKYFSSKFDGSEKEEITEAVYNSIDNNTKEIYKPLSFNNYQVYDYSIQTSFDSKVYIKTDDYDEQKDSVYVCYYDSDEKLLGVFPLKAKNYGNYLECDFIPIVTAFPYYTKVMFWKDNIVPMCKSLCFQ